MKRKSILEQVEEQEERRKDSERDMAAIKWAFIGIGFIIALSITVGGYYLFKPKELTAEEVREKNISKHTAKFKRECETEVKGLLKSPSSYSHSSVLQYGGYEGVIILHFTAKNSFGVELSQQAVCSYDYYGVTDIQVSDM